MTVPARRTFVAYRDIRGIKESSPEFGRIGVLANLRGGQFSVLAGRDSAALESLNAGAKAWGAGLG